MLFPALLIGDHRIQVYIFHTAENMGLHIGIFLLHGADELLDLYPFGTIFLVVAGGTRVRELAGALDEMQVVVIPPRFDVILPDEVQRADQLHALKVGTVQLGHHRLDLGAVEHAHENRLDDISRSDGPGRSYCSPAVLQNCTGGRGAFWRTDNRGISPHGTPNQKYPIQKSPPECAAFWHYPR